MLGVDWARLLPTVTLYVHLTDHTLATGHGVEGTVLGVVFISGLVAILALGRRR